MMENLLKTGPSRYEKLTQIKATIMYINYRKYLRINTDTSEVNNDTIKLSVSTDQCQARTCCDTTLTCNK